MTDGSFYLVAATLLVVGFAYGAFLEAVGAIKSAQARKGFGQARAD